MDNSTRKVFHEDYPIDITNMSDTEIAAAVAAFRKSKGLNPPPAESVKPKIAAKGKKAKKEKKERTTSRMRRGGRK